MYLSCIVVHMRPEFISINIFVVSLLLLSISVSADPIDELSFLPNATPKPPLALIAASMNSEEGFLTHDNVYQIDVQVANTRPHKVDGRVEVSAFSLAQSPIVLGHEVVDIEPNENASLLFTFTPTFPCANYIFMATTNPNELTHINERDYIFVDGRHEFVFTDCAEEIEGDIIENAISERYNEVEIEKVNIVEKGDDVDETNDESKTTLAQIQSKEPDNETNDESERTLAQIQPKEPDTETNDESEKIVAQIQPKEPENETNDESERTLVQIQPKEPDNRPFAKLNINRTYAKIDMDKNFTSAK